MKKLGFTILCALWGITTMAQPRPFEPDPSFVPSLDFMQKTWSGEYDGLEPNSGMILSLRRKLVLNTNLTYTNEVRGHVKNQSEEVLLRHETGTYLYDENNHVVTYSIEVDSTLDINILLKGEELSYSVNHYLEVGTVKTSTEDVQFTRAASDDARQWILFDQQLMSPIDPRQKSVYVMTGKKTDTSLITVSSYDCNTERKDLYNMDGKIIKSPSKGIYVINGKKFLIK